MDWTQAIDAYCERTDASYWSEPVNALTNLAFMLSALIMWRRTRGGGRVLAVVLFLIGIGSWLFHTHATAWSAAADSGFIMVYVFVYIYLANKDYLGWPIWGAALGAAAYIPYTAVLTPGFEALPFFTISSFYWPLPVLIFGYAIWLSSRAPDTARGLAIGAGILCLSLAFRSVDETWCADFPLGTHFMWHILNAVMLGWMIEVWQRHTAKAPAT